MDLLDFYRSFEITAIIKAENKSLTRIDLLVFILICGLLDRDGITTMYDVNRLNSGENKLRLGGTHRYVNRLHAKGYVKKDRKREYFAKTFLTLTEKGLILKSRLRSLIDTPLEG